MDDKLPERGEELWYDTLIYVGIVLVAFGIGHRLNLWLANDAYLAPIMYTSILLIVYWKWVISQHNIN